MPVSNYVILHLKYKITNTRRLNLRVLPVFSFRLHAMYECMHHECTTNVPVVTTFVSVYLALLCEYKISCKLSSSFDPSSIFALILKCAQVFRLKPCFPFLSLPFLSWKMSCDSPDVRASAAADGIIFLPFIIRIPHHYEKLSLLLLLSFSLFSVHSCEPISFAFGP